MYMSGGDGVRCSTPVCSFGGVLRAWRVGVVDMSDSSGMRCIVQRVVDLWQVEKEVAEQWSPRMSNKLCNNKLCAPFGFFSPPLSEISNQTDGVSSRPDLSLPTQFGKPSKQIDLTREDAIYMVQANDLLHNDTCARPDITQNPCERYNEEGGRDTTRSVTAGDATARGV